MKKIQIEPALKCQSNDAYHHLHSPRRFRKT